MERNTRKRIRASIRRNKQRRLLSRVATLISVAIVFGVAMSLMQPVITMTTICGREEHAHTEAC